MQAIRGKFGDSEDFHVENTNLEEGFNEASFYFKFLKMQISNKNLQLHILLYNLLSVHSLTSWFFFEAWRGTLPGEAPMQDQSRNLRFTNFKALRFEHNMEEIFLGKGQVFGNKPELC